MCSTCNPKNFEKVVVNETEKLEQSLGFGSLVIRCDVKAKDYSMAVKTEPKSEYRIYRCPTCGRQLF